MSNYLNNPIMKDETLIPLLQCNDVDLKDQSSVDITTLHETGHLIVMYALDMMDYFSYITINPGSGTLGLTETTDEYKTFLNEYATELQKAGIPNSGLNTTNLIRKIIIKGTNLYLPNICRLFGGGAICRFYGVPDEKMCTIDYSYIDTMLMGLGLTGKREVILPLVDMYLKSVFESFDLLTKAIYKNLREKGTLNKNQVMQIIGEWEEFEPE